MTDATLNAGMSSPVNAGDFDVTCEYEAPCGIIYKIAKRAIPVSDGWHWCVCKREYIDHGAKTKDHVIEGDGTYGTKWIECLGDGTSGIEHIGFPSFDLAFEHMAQHAHTWDVYDKIMRDAEEGPNVMDRMMNGLGLGRIKKQG